MTQPSITRVLAVALLVIGGSLPAYAFPPGRPSGVHSSSRHYGRPSYSAHDLAFIREYLRANPTPEMRRQLQKEAEGKRQLEIVQAKREAFFLEAWEKSVEYRPSAESRPSSEETPGERYWVPPSPSLLSLSPRSKASLEGLPLEPLVVSMLPHDEATLEAVYDGTRRLTARVNHELETVSAFHEIFEYVKPTEGIGGSRDLTSTLMRDGRDKTVIVTAHSWTKDGERYLVLPDGTRCRTADLEQFILFLGSYPIIVACHEESLGVGEIGITETVAAVKFAVEGFSAGKNATPLEIQAVIRDRLHKTGRKVYVKGSIIVVLGAALTKALLHEEKEEEKQPLGTSTPDTPAIRGVRLLSSGGTLFGLVPTCVALILLLASMASPASASGAMDVGPSEFPGFGDDDSGSGSD